MNGTPMFYQKNGWAVVKLARDLTNMEVGDRILSYSQYAELFDSGRGTIQYAVKFLLDHGCVTLHKYGPKGTFITSLDYDKLWEFTDWGTLLCVIPGLADYTISSLATGIYANFKDAGIPFSHVNMVNSRSRLVELANNRYHCVVSTRLAMKALGDEYPQLEVVAEMPNCTYMTPFVLYHHQDRFAGIKDGMRIAVNPRSMEQVYIADMICRGKDVARLEFSNQEAARAFASGEVDLFVARPTMISLETKSQIHRCESLSYLGIDQDSIVPVFVVNKENYGMGDLLRKRLSISQITKIQREVLSGERRPSYY